MAEVHIATLDDLGSVEGLRALVRVDFNVPVTNEGAISDDTRIRRAIPTIRELVGKGCRIVLMSHRGRPKGWGGASLDIAVERLRELSGLPVGFVDDIVGEKARQAVHELAPGQCLVLQNVRYEPGEKAGDVEFARQLAGLGDFYVNDAFGTAHRADVSVAIVPTLLPAYAGRLLMAEIAALTPLAKGPERPYWAVIGGSKVSDKVTLLGALLEHVDGIAIGGGMANTFLKAQGFDMGASKVEVEALAQAENILHRARQRGADIVLPDLVLAAQGFSPDAPARVTSPGHLDASEMALDVAGASVDAMLGRLKSAATIFWNGPLGVFEWERFREGTMRMARGLAALSARVVVGGGDSVAAAELAGIGDRLFHVSTGGGAALELLEGAALPGVEALKHSPRG